MKFLTILTITLSTLVALSSQATPIQKQNAKDAAKLQKKFDKLTANSPCKENDVACIGGAFAKCHNVIEDGKIVLKYSIQPCGPGTECFVLPLVLKRGTSVTCTTEEDRDRRFKDAGGKPPKKSKKTKKSKPTKRATDIAKIRKQNAKEAKALQKKFKNFKPNRKCKVDEVACIGGAFAKCHNVMENGKIVARFSIQPCAGGLQCFPLPLVLKRGVSLACTTKQDFLARLKQAEQNL